MAMLLVWLRSLTGWEQDLKSRNLISVAVLEMFALDHRVDIIVLSVVDSMPIATRYRGSALQSMSAQAGCASG